MTEIYLHIVARMAALLALPHATQVGHTIAAWLRYRRADFCGSTHDMRWVVAAVSKIGRDSGAALPTAFTMVPGACPYNWYFARIHKIQVNLSRAWFLKDR